MPETSGKFKSNPTKTNNLKYIILSDENIRQIPGSTLFLIFVDFQI